MILKEGNDINTEYDRMACMYLVCCILRECSNVEEFKAYLNQTEAVYNATALHFAVQRGHTEAALFLLDNGAAFDRHLEYSLSETFPDYVRGDTALHIACSKGLIRYYIIDKAYR